MKAAVLRESHAPLTIEEVQVDRPGPREVLLRTGTCGVCHSDLHAVDRPSSQPMPRVLGHEAAGTVEAVGELVTSFRPGDRVIACLTASCGHCPMCLRGRWNLCADPDRDRRPGDPPRLSQAGAAVHQMARLAGFAEQMLVHEHALVKIGPEAPFAALALVGCAVVTGVGAVLNTARITPGCSVAVIGCGGIGLNCVQGARLGGARRIIAIDRAAAKLELARAFGATDAIDASAGDVVERVRELTGGGVEYAFEALGLKETAEQAIAMLDRGGVATLIGLPAAETTIELAGQWLVLPERRVQGCFMGSTRFRVDMPTYVDWYLQGRLKLDELVTRQLPLSEINRALDDLRAGRGARSVVVFE